MQYDHTGFAHAKDGTKLFYGIAGRGDLTIVLNDGIGCDGFAWTHLHPALCELARVVHWHYRGHGRSGSPVNREHLSLPDLAADQIAVMDHVGVDDALVIGHSMGVQVSLEFYRAAKARTRGLVLLCGSYGKVTKTFHGTGILERVLPTVRDVVTRNPGLARAIWGRIPPALAYKLAKLSREIDGLGVSEKDFVHYMSHIASLEPELFLAMLSQAGDHTAEDLLSEIDVPTLVIAAERDTFTPASLAAYMAEKIPGSDYLFIKGGSHAAPVEQPQPMLEAIDRLIARIPTRTQSGLKTA